MSTNILSRLTFSIITALTIFSVSDYALSQSYEVQLGEVIFKTSSTFGTVTGNSKKLTGEIDFESKEVFFKIPSNSFKTGISLRDKHIKDRYMQSSMYPYVTFKGKLPDLDFSDNKLYSVEIPGHFSLHGINKAITIEGTIQKIDDNLSIKANWILNFRDFKITSIFGSDDTKSFHTNINLTLKK